MSMFEYMMILIIIIMGLSLSKIVTDCVRLIQAKNRTLSALHLSLVAIIILIHLQLWAGYAQQFHNIEKINIITIIVAFIPPLLLIGISELLFPEANAGDNHIDMREYYRLESKRIYSWVIYYIISVILYKAYITTGELKIYPMIFRISLIAIILILIKFRDTRERINHIIHSSFVIIGVIVFSYYIYKYSFIIKT